MNSEIGSNFWINPYESLQDKPLDSPIQFGIKGSDYAWLSTGRSASLYVIQEIAERSATLPRRVLLPPFTCHTVIEPFLSAGYDIGHYHIDHLLQAKASQIIEEAVQWGASVVLYHQYFGFETIINDINLFEELHKKGITIIEDCTQSLYSDFGKGSADFTVGSIRKWLGLPDGGFALCKNGTFEQKPSICDYRLEEAKVKASHNKYKFLFEHEGDKALFLQQYRDAEDILNSQQQFYRIGDMSAQLQSNLDTENLKRRRRDNYKTLLAGIPQTDSLSPVLTKLGENIVPLYFPIVVNDRKALQDLLVGHAIYAPVVWPKPDSLHKVCQAAEYLYEHLLCIPIDQRYDIYDMNRVIDALREWISLTK